MLDAGQNGLTRERHNQSTSLPQNNVMEGGRHHLVKLEIDGAVINTRNRLLQAVAKYYEDLYSKEAVTSK